MDILNNHTSTQNIFPTNLHTTCQTSDWLNLSPNFRQQSTNLQRLWNQPHHYQYHFNCQQMGPADKMGSACESCSLLCHFGTVVVWSLPSGKWSNPFILLYDWAVFCQHDADDGLIVDPKQADWMQRAQCWIYVIGSPNLDETEMQHPSLLS